MVAWYWLLITASVFTSCGVILGAILRASANADYERSATYWRDQCLRLCIRHNDTMPVGPVEE